jgi:hypothetical protein
MIQAYIVSDDGRQVMLGVRPYTDRGCVYHCFSSSGFGSEKIAGIMELFIDRAGTHREPRSIQ